MRVRLIPIALVAILFFQAYDAFSQANPLRPDDKKSAIYLGPVVGYNKTFHSANLASFAEDPLCPFFENGSSNGYYVGVFYEHHLGAEASSKHSIIGRVLYNTMGAFFEKEGDIYPSLVDDGQGGVKRVDSKTRHTIDVVYDALTVETMYAYNLVGGFRVTVGLVGDFHMTNTLTQTYEIVEPDNVQFSPQPGKVYSADYRTITVQDGDIPDATSFRLAAKFGVQYEIITGTAIDVIPSAYYNFGLTKLSSAEDWRVDLFQIGVDIRFAL